MTDLVEKTLKEPNFIIRSSSAMTTLQQKAWVFMYLHAKNSLDDVYHYLQLADLVNILETTYREELKESLVTMNRATVQWDTFGLDGEVKSWTTSSMIGSVLVDGNTVKYEFTQAMKEVFRENPGFAQLDLPSLIALRGKHAIKLWRICKIYKDTLTGSTGWQTVERWRKVFGLKPEMYNDFKDFNKHILKKAVKEINTVTDMRIKAEYKKNGRIVTEIRFLRMSDTKEAPKQINEAPKPVKIPAFREWFNNKPRSYRNLFDAKFEALCDVDDPIVRSRIYDEQIRIAMAEESPQMDMFER